MERHLNKKARRNSNKAHLKGPKKRTKKDDERFSESFEKLIQKALAASWFFQISFLQKLERWYKKSRDKEKYLREEYSRLSEEKDRLYAKYGSLKKRMRGQEQDKALYLPWHTHIIFKQFNVCMSTVRWGAWTPRRKSKNCWKRRRTARSPPRRWRKPDCTATFCRNFYFFAHYNLLIINFQSATVFR